MKLFDPYTKAEPKKRSGRRFESVCGSRCSTLVKMPQKSTQAAWTCHSARIFWWWDSVLVMIAMALLCQPKLLSDRRWPPPSVRVWRCKPQYFNLAERIKKTTPSIPSILIWSLHWICGVRRRIMRESIGGRIHAGQTNWITVARKTYFLSVPTTPL